MTIHYPNRLIPSLMVIALTLGLGCASSAAVPAEAPTTALASAGAESAPKKEAIPGDPSAGEPTSTRVELPPTAGPSAGVSGETEGSPNKEATLAGASVGEPASTPAEAPSTVIQAGADPAPKEEMIAVGVNVGDRAPEFAIVLAGGTTVTSQQLIDQGKPAFLMFFATW